MDKSKLVILLLLLFIIGIVSFLNSSYFIVEKVHIKGNELLSDQYIIEFCNLDREVNVFNIQQEKLANKLVSLPQIKGAVIHRNLPRQVVIRIKERVPVAIISNESSYLVINKEGCILKALDNTADMDLPLFVDVNLERGKKKVKLTKNSKLAVDYLSKLSNSSLGQIQEFKIDSTGEVILILRDGGKVNLGKKFNITRKAKIFNKVYSDIQKKGVGIKYINLKYNKNIFIKLKK